MPINEFLTQTQAFWVSWLMLGAFAFCLSVTAGFAGYAIRAANSQIRPAWIFALPVIFMLWGGAAFATSVTYRLDFVFLGPMILLPILLGWAVSYMRWMVTILSNIPLHWMIWIQVFRVAGGVFLYYMALGLLTPGFAWPAGVGDVLTGVAAIPVAWLVLRDPVRWKGLFVGWSLFGIGDLVVAVTAAAIFNFEATDVELTFAITAIPLFLGPPFGILIHIMTWRAYNLQMRAKPAAAAP
ncbi:MAG: hypothetical protein AAF218_02800 [Pseudomonadota bacterium]